MRGATPLCAPHVGAQLPTPSESGRSAPRPGLLSRVEKVGKDTPGTSWSLDPQHKGGGPPWIPPTLCPSGIGCDSLNPQASSEATHLPRHGLTAGSVTPMQLGEKKRPICPPAQSGKSTWVGGRNPIEGVAACRRGSEASPSGGPGAQPRHAFGSFRRETKGTPGVGRVGPPMGRSAEEGLSPPRIRECRRGTGGAAPRKRKEILR